VVRLTAARRPAWPFAVIGLAVVLGAVVGFFLATTIDRPGRADIRRAAASLVPPEAVVVGTTDVSGSSLVVGQYRAEVEFEHPGSDEERLAALERTASQSGWSSAGAEDAPGATNVEYRRDRVAARVSIDRNRGLSGVAASTRGRVTARADGGPAPVALAAWAVGVAIAAGGAAALLFRRRIT
jgi:hypothetical protein